MLHLLLLYVHELLEIKRLKQTMLPILQIKHMIFHLAELPMKYIPKLKDREFQRKQTYIQCIQSI